MALAAPQATAAEGRQLSFTDASGDAATSPVAATAYGGGAFDIESVRLEASGRVLRVTVSTAGPPAVEEFAGYDVTMRAVRRCQSTVYPDGFPVEVRFRSGPAGEGQATFRGCGAQVAVPVQVQLQAGRGRLTAAVPLAQLPHLQGVVLDHIAASAGMTDWPYDGIMRLSVDTASTDRQMRLP